MADFAAPRTLPEGKGSLAADGIFPRDVTHFRGTMRVEHKPARIVVLATGQLDQAITLGFVPVGTTINGYPDPVPAYLERHFPQHAAAIAAIKPLGARTVLDFDAIAALRPDVIVGTAAGAHGRAFNELNAIAPTFLTEGYGYNWKQDFLLVAELLGERARANAVMDAYHARTDTLRQRLHAAGRDRDEVSFARLGPKGLELYGEKAFVGTIATDLGLTRPLSQRFPAISKIIAPAEVDAIDGDVLFYGEIDYPLARAAREGIAGRWPDLRAVAHGRARLVEMEPWYTMVAPTSAGIVLDDIEAALLG